PCNEGVRCQQPTHFPYTTLFRSTEDEEPDSEAEGEPGGDAVAPSGALIPEELAESEDPARERDPSTGTPAGPPETAEPATPGPRSEEHTSELQSRENLVCRLLPE